MAGPTIQQKRIKGYAISILVLLIFFFIIFFLGGGGGEGGKTNNTTEERIRGHLISILVLLRSTGPESTDTRWLLLEYSFGQAKL